MPTISGILRFMRMINSILSLNEHENFLQPQGYTTFFMLNSTEYEIATRLLIATKMLKDD